MLRHTTVNLFLCEWVYKGINTTIHYIWLNMLINRYLLNTHQSSYSMNLEAYILYSQLHKIFVVSIYDDGHTILQVYIKFFVIGNRLLSYTS